MSAIIVSLGLPDAMRVTVELWRRLAWSRARAVLIQKTLLKLDILALSLCWLALRLTPNLGLNNFVGIIHTGLHERTVVPLRLIHGDSGRVCLALSSAFAPEHIGK